MVNKFVSELEAQLEGRDVILEVDEEARAWLPKMAMIRKWAQDHGAIDPGAN